MWLKGKWLPVLITAVFVLSLVAVAGCGGGKEGSKEGAKEGAKTPIKIGALYPMSGRAADFGKTSWEAIQMAVKEINDKGGVQGRKLEVQVEDSKNPQEAVRIVNKYIKKDGVDFVMGEVSSASALAISEVAKTEKKILIVTDAATPQLTSQKGHRYVFRSANNVEQSARAGAHVAAKKPWKKYFVIGPDYEYGHVAWECFLDELKKQRTDIEVVGEAWPKLYEPDYTNYINAIVKAQPDAVFNSMWGGDIVAFIKQAKPYGLFEKMTFISEAWGDYTVLKALGPEMPEGQLASARYFWFYPDTTANKDFVSRYKAAWSDYPGYAAMGAYNAVVFLTKAIEKAKSTDTEKVIDALEGMEIETPEGKSLMRKVDHQVIEPLAWGFTKKTPDHPFLILGDWQVITGEKVSPSEEKVNELRKGGK